MRAKRDLRWGVKEILERRENGEEPLWNELKIAMSHVVHKVDITYITSKAYDRRCPGEYSCQQWYSKECEI